MNWWSPEGREVWGRAKQRRGRKRYKLPGIREINHGDEKYSTGTTVRKIVMTPVGDRWSLLSPGEQTVRYTIVTSLCCTNKI